VKVNYKSLTKARNDILSKAGGFDILTFLDDDVELDKNYFSVISKIFDDSRVAGCQGFIKHPNFIKAYMLNILSGVPITSSPRVNDYLWNTYPLFTLKRIMNAEWLSGCNMSYRVKDIDGKKFNEDFILYALGEDLDFSYQLHLEGKKLLLVSEAKLIHRPSGLKDIPGKVAILMRLAYRRYMIAKYRKDNIEELFKKYVSTYKRAFFPLRMRNEQKWKNAVKLIDSCVKMIEEFSDNIDSGSLKEVNNIILQEVSR